MPAVRSKKKSHEILGTSPEHGQGIPNQLEDKMRDITGDKRKARPQRRTQHSSQDGDTKKALRQQQTVWGKLRQTKKYVRIENMCKRMSKTTLNAPSSLPSQLKHLSFMRDNLCWVPNLLSVVNMLKFKKLGVNSVHIKYSCPWATFQKYNCHNLNYQIQWGAGRWKVMSSDVKSNTKHTKPMSSDFSSERLCHSDGTSPGEGGDGEARGDCPRRRAQTNGAKVTLWKNMFFLNEKCVKWMCKTESITKKDLGKSLWDDLADWLHGERFSPAHSNRSKYREPTWEIGQAGHRVHRVP